MNKKDYFKIGSIVVIAAIILSGMCYKFCIKNCEIYEKERASISEIDESNVERMHATYGFDVTNLENVVSDADYTFVAKVDKILGTVYKYPVKIEDTWISEPYTKYRLKYAG